MATDEARAAVDDAAREFATGRASIREMWTALHDNLHDLCADAPLSGDYLDLFNALERWETATRQDRDDEIEAARQIAERVGATP